MASAREKVVVLILSACVAGGVLLAVSFFSGVGAAHEEVLTVLWRLEAQQCGVDK